MKVKLTQDQQGFEDAVKLVRIALPKIVKTFQAELEGKHKQPSREIAQKQ